MIQSAMQTHRKIFPCSHHTDLQDCFTEHNDHLLFWYNTEDRSTHLITRKIPSAIREATSSADR